MTPRQQSRFKRDRLRDISIFSLFQGSGIRVNEFAGLQMTDIDSLKIDINVVRKGNEADTVSIFPSSMDDLMFYLNKFVLICSAQGSTAKLDVEFAIHRDSH